MNQSLWLKQHVEEVQGKRDKSNQSKKVILILVPLMMLLIMIGVMAGSKDMDEQVKMGMIAMLGTFVGIMLLVVLLISKGKKVDATKGTRESVMAILKTDEDVQIFDAEMRTQPLREVVFSPSSNLFVTQSYIGVSFLLMGDLQYRFAKKEEVAAVNFSRLSHQRGRDIFFDVLNNNGEKIFGAVASNTNKLEEVVMVMKEFNPGLRVSAK